MRTLAQHVWRHRFLYYIALVVTVTLALQLGWDR